MPENSEILVSICCITYNHRQFIYQCLDGILMQVTKFSIEIIIYDDASNDGTAEVIREYEKKYPKIIKPIYQKENQFSKGIRGITAKFTFPRTNGKYIALCEGDDYWLDPYKLQKQVDFLEINPDYGMVHTGVQVVDKNGKLILVSDSEKPSGEVFYDLLLGSAFIITCSVCARRDLIMEAVKYANGKNLKCVFDYWLWLHIAMRSKIHYYRSVTSAYRSHSQGITQSNKKYLYNIIPLAVLDVVSYKFKHYPEKRFIYRWRMFIAYCRTITSRSITIKDRIHYSVFFIKHPVSFFAFIPALFKKILNKLKKVEINGGFN